MSDQFPSRRTGAVLRFVSLPIVPGSRAIRKQSPCLIDAPAEVKESAFRTSFTETGYAECSEAMGLETPILRTSSVASFPPESEKNVLVPRFFLLFSLLDVP